MSNKYGKSVFTDDLNVVWSHLHKPDVKFGNPHHSITVVLNDDLNAVLKENQATLGANKINGLGETKEGVQTLKVRNVLKAKEGIQTFPCVDSNAKETKAIPFGGDVCRLKLAPCLLDRDGSMSFYLDGCQIITKNDTGSAGAGFAVTDGFVNEDMKNAMPDADATPASADVPQEDMGDIPF